MRVPEQPGPSGRPTIPPLEELERQTEEALAGRQSAAGEQAGPSVPNPCRQAQLAGGDDSDVAGECQYVV